MQVRNNVEVDDAADDADMNDVVVELDEQADQTNGVCEGMEMEVVAVQLNAEANGADMNDVVVELDEEVRLLNEEASPCLKSN